MRKQRTEEPFNFIRLDIKICFILYLASFFLSFRLHLIKNQFSFFQYTTSNISDLTLFWQFVQKEKLQAELFCHRNASQARKHLCGYPEVNN